MNILLLGSIPVRVTKTNVSELLCNKQGVRIRFLYEFRSRKRLKCIRTGINLRPFYFVLQDAHFAVYFISTPTIDIEPQKSRLPMHAGKRDLRLEINQAGQILPLAAAKDLSVGLSIFKASSKTTEKPKYSLCLPALDRGLSYRKQHG